jgi:hypothetical protein
MDRNFPGATRYVRESITQWRNRRQGQTGSVSTHRLVIRWYRVRAHSPLARNVLKIFHALHPPGRNIGYLENEERLRDADLIIAKHGMGKRRR